MGRLSVGLVALVFGLGAGCGGGDSGPAPDTTPPVITAGPDVSDIGHESVTVSWSTDEDATSLVRYGKTTSYGDSVAASALVRDHSLRLTGLDALTLYHFRVYSADEAGNAVGSSDRVFTTTSPIGKLVAEGWDFFEAGEYDSSLARFTAAEALDADHIDVLEGLVWTYHYVYEFAACEAALERAFDVDEDRADCLVAAAFLYQATEAFGDAVVAAESALARVGPAYVFEHDGDVTDEDVRYSLILALAALGDFDGALEEARVLDPAIVLDPADPGTWGAYSTFEEAMIGLIEDLRSRV